MLNKNGKLSCEEVKQLLPEYVAEVLNRVTHQAVQNHLISCPKCRREAYKQRVIFDNFVYYIAAKKPSVKVSP
ncbi:MAG: hypothetical protein DRI26_02135 [Chloroflexi bacterium]|nr:MAG: hypothetical protein DRI26_02135 [Chloroflexota bacterium]